MIRVDFKALREEGSIGTRQEFDTLIEALTVYKNLNESLRVTSEVALGEPGEAFDYELHITTEAPFIITVKLHLI